MGDLGTKKFAMGNSNCFSDDLFIEILSWSSTKSLYRFMSVSKSFAILISHVLSQRKIQPMSALFFFTQDDDKKWCKGYASVDGRRLETFLSLLPNNPSCIKTCKGFLFLLCHGKTASVWNPFTNQRFTLPERSSIPYEYTYPALIFDPDCSPHYKVIRFLGQHGPDCLGMEIFSSETGGWVVSKVPSQQLDDNKCWRKWSPRSVYMNGALYILSEPHHILCFDVKEESFSLIWLPMQARVGGKYSCMGESQGCLFYSAQLDRSLQIWMLKKKTNNFVLVHALSLYSPMNHRFGIDSSPCIIRKSFIPLAFHPNLFLMYLCLQGKIFSYWPKVRRLKEVSKIRGYKPPNLLDWSSVLPFIPYMATFGASG